VTMPAKMTAEQIREVFEKERPDFRVTSRSQVPPSYAAITTEWLTDVLCHNTQGAQVVSHKLGVRDDGSANRRRIFVTYNDAGNAARLPASVFCKAAETLQNRIVLGVSGSGKAETDFFTKVRPLLDIETPIALYAGFDPANQASFTLMPDIAGEVTFCDEHTPMDWDRATSQIDLLSKLHSRFYESPMLGTDAIPFRNWSKWWSDMMIGDPHFAEYCDIGFGDSEDIMPARLFRRRAEIWPATEKASAAHAHLPKALIHCDVHLKNWYITKSGGMGISDWQCVNIGHWSRDLIYAITAAHTVENRRKWEKDLVTLYLDKMASLGVPKISDDEAWGYLRQQLFSALAFWTITLRPTPGMPPMQPEETSRTFLKRLYTAIDDLEALDSFG
jgi:thiamine kinase-like enzyme